MRIAARGKINWTLDIVGRREDGYHLMDMLMQPVTLEDEVTLGPADSLTLTCGGWPRLTPREDNLALRAARTLQEATGCRLGAAIHVEKRVPVGAGMGGGSADAAAVLFGLNRLWGTGLSETELERIGLTLGADVPFCLRGGLTRTTGVGEIMENLPCKRSFPLVVVQPCRGLSTGTVFQAYHAAGESRRPDTEAARLALEGGDLPMLSAALSNVLEPVSRDMRPEIGQAVEALRAAGASAALMTGSGSAVFGVFDEPALASRTARGLQGRWRAVWRCATCRDSLCVLD